MRTGRKSAAIRARYDSKIVTLPEPSSVFENEWMEARSRQEFTTNRRLLVCTLVLRSKSNKGVIPGAGRNGHMFVLHWCYFRAQMSLCRDSPIQMSTDNNDAIIRLGRPFNTEDLKEIQWEHQLGNWKTYYRALAPGMGELFGCNKFSQGIRRMFLGDLYFNGSMDVWGSG